MDSVENDIFVARQGHHAKFDALSSEEQQLNEAVAAVEAEIIEWLSSEETGKPRPATAGARPSTAHSEATQVADAPFRNIFSSRRHPRIHAACCSCLHDMSQEPAAAVDDDDDADDDDDDDDDDEDDDDDC